MGQIDFFSKFPKIKYPYRGKILRGSEEQFVDVISCFDITVRFKFREELLKNPLSYFPYVWEDGDRPDTIAELYYGDEKYAWVVLLSANIFDWIHELPLSATELDEYLIQKYLGLEINGTLIEEVYDLYQVIHHYETSDGYIVDTATYNALSDPGKRAVSYYENQVIQNEQRRQVRLINNTYLQRVVSEFEDKMRDIKRSRKKQPISFSQAGE